MRFTSGQRSQCFSFQQHSFHRWSPADGSFRLLSTSASHLALSAICYALRCVGRQQVQVEMRKYGSAKRPESAV